MQLYQQPPLDAHVLCVDEMGPVSTKSYESRRWAPAQQRPQQAPDYGRRGNVWVFGALEPATGQVVTTIATQRNTEQFLQLLDQVVQQWPTGELFIILDNLSIHKALDVRLWLLVHPRVRLLFPPTYAPWLNLIEPWWKPLRSLALKGCRFETVTQLVVTLVRATAYWNAHRHPYVWRKAA